MTKHLELQDLDVKQAIVLSKLMSEAKFDIKGDAIPLAANSIQWLQQLVERLKNAKDCEIDSPPKAKKTKGE